MSVPNSDKVDGWLAAIRTAPDLISRVTPSRADRERLIKLTAERIAANRQPALSADW